MNAENVDGKFKKDVKTDDVSFTKQDTVHGIYVSTLEEEAAPVNGGWTMPEG